jgi:hypothetical protein
MGQPQGIEYEEVTGTPLKTKQAAAPAAPGPPPSSPIQDQGVTAPATDGDKPSA